MGDLTNTSIGRQKQRQLLVQNVLENVVATVRERTPFQRVIASCFDRPIVPGDPESRTGVLEYAAAGLSVEDEQLLLSLVSNGYVVTGGRYRAEAAIGRAYYYPCAAGLSGDAVCIESRRRYLSQGGWSDRDVLLVPLLIEGRIIGQISIDDPRDGARPSTTTLAFLEEIAKVASVSVQDASTLERLTEAHRLFRFLADGGITGVIVVQGDAIVYSNDRACELLGFTQAELVSMAPWWSFLHQDDRPFAWRCIEDAQYASRTIRAIRKDGREIWLAAYGHRMEYRRADAVACQFYDITERVETELQLKEKALRDPLTGLRNRAYFDDTIHLEISRSKRYRRPLTLMMADLRGFKRINDALGHQEGDRILCGIAGIFRDQLRDSDWVVRYGGDEFLFVLPETGDRLETLVERMERTVAAWGADNAPPDVGVGVDFGWAMWSPDAPQPIALLLQAADANLYERKRRWVAEHRRADS